MSFNLSGSSRALFTTEIINKAGAYLGESESNIQKGLSGILPVILGSLADKSASVAGANIVTKMVQDQQHSVLSANPANFFANDGGILLIKRADLLHELFGSRFADIPAAIATFSGLKLSSVISLLSMALPVILNLMGSHISESGAGNVSTMLNAQKDNIAAALPAGLDVDGISGGRSTWVSDINVHVKTAAPYSNDTNEKTSDSALKLLLPIVLLILLGLAALYLFGKGCNTK